MAWFSGRPPLPKEEQSNPLGHQYGRVERDVATGQLSARLWAAHSALVRDFWQRRVMAADSAPISDDDCDPVIRILDRNAKGNTKESQAVARAMVAQGAWRRMINKLHADKRLGQAMNDVLTETSPSRRAKALDRLYDLNKGERNYLTGSSGNAVCAFLAAYDPVENVSVISLKDRRSILHHLGVDVPFDWDRASIGTRIVETNQLIRDAARALGVEGSARTISRFFYFPAVKALWRGEHTVRR
jgi:hypothetical protein